MHLSYLLTVVFLVCVAATAWGYFREKGRRQKARRRRGWAADGGTSGAAWYGGDSGGGGHHGGGHHGGSSCGGVVRAAAVAGVAAAAAAEQLGCIRGHHRGVVVALGIVPGQTAELKKSGRSRSWAAGDSTATPWWASRNDGSGQDCSGQHSSSSCGGGSGFGGGSSCCGG